MAVPSVITDLNVVAGLNVPVGGEDVFPQLDNYLRTHAAFIAQLRGQIDDNDLTKYQLACSDLTSDLQINDEAAYFRTQRAFALNTVRTTVIEASSSGPVEIDILSNGVSILSTALTIDQDELTSTTAAVPAVISNAEIPDDALVLIKIVAPGVGSRGLVVALQGADV